jgi:phospholipase C
MSRSLRRVLAFAIGSFTVMAAGPIFTAVQVGASDGNDKERLGGLAGINHLVVIYDENRSFDNLYGFFDDANGIDPQDESLTPQVDLAGNPYTCLPQATPPLTGTCLDNQPFDITQYIPASKPTIDLVHRFYQEQVQIDGGKMDKFVAVSDAKALAMGYYPTASLPVAKEAAGQLLPCCLRRFISQPPVADLRMLARVRECGARRRPRRPAHGARF